MLKVGMIDADLIDNGTRHPNLAQMKISKYCKDKGHVTQLIFGDLLNNLEEYDAIIISKVFNFTKLPHQITEKFPEVVNNPKLLNTSIIETLEDTEPKKKPVLSIGGTGFFNDGGRNLDPCIEHIMPDYTLYDEYIAKMVEEGYKESSFNDYKYFSIGFTTRGCFRKCSFCVNKKYSRCKKHADVNEFLDETRPGIYLWDDNILACGKDWENILNQLNFTGKPFQFRQGLDIRLITEKRAKILSQSMYYGDYIFAFDHIEDKDIIIKKLRIWRKYCKKTTKLYVLCAYDPHNSNITLSNYDPELIDVINTFERIKILMEHGCLPYIMRYEDYNTSKFRDVYVQLARWCNQPQFFKKKSFGEFCKANQDYTKGEEYCSAFKAMTDFESKYPEIAKKYFYLKYENENEYDLSFNYGRIKTEPCEICIINSITWDSVVASKTDEWLKYYYEKTLDLYCLVRKNPTCGCRTNSEKACERLIRALKSHSISDIIKLIDTFPYVSIDSAFIPQFGGDLSYCTDLLIDVLKECDAELSYETLGSKLYRGKNNKVSNTKFGENHAKTASMLDLAIIKTSNDPKDHRKYVLLSPLGEYISKMNIKDRADIYRKLILRIPIIQQLIIHTKEGHVYLSDIISKSGIRHSTAIRRTTNIKKLIEFVSETSEKDVSTRLEMIHYKREN